MHLKTKSVIYNIKTILDTKFLALLGVLLGEEWTSPVITKLNIDSNNVIYGNTNDPSDYPDTPLVTKDQLIKCVEELIELDKIDHDIANYLIDLIDKLPKKFELPNEMFNISC